MTFRSGISRDALALVCATAAIGAGCAPSISPRTADTLPAGRVGFEGHFSAWAFGWGEAEHTDTNGKQTVYTGGADIAHSDNPVAVGGSIAGSLVEAGVRVGATRWLEMGASFGAQRTGGEVRVALADEDIRHPLSVTMSTGAYYSFLGDGPWGRVGFDISKRFGAFALLLDPYVSRGFTVHSGHYDLPGDDDCPQSGYPWTVCGDVLIERTIETRISVAVGGAVSLAEGRAAVTFGGVPHVVVERQPLSCDECGKGTLAHTWGLHLIVGLQTPGW